MPAPVVGTYPAYFEKYIKLVVVDNIDEAISQYSKSFEEFFSDISEEKSSFRYSKDKWSLKELLQHVTDTERIFAFRALSISRGEKNPLPGFDENSYVVESGADSRSWKSILEEFIAVRKSTDLLLKSFNNYHLNKSGTTNGQPNTVNAVSYIIFGHILHSINIVKERYL